MSAVVEVMADVTPGVAFDLSVNLESRAFIGSILVADVSSKLCFTLNETERKSEGKIPTLLKWGSLFFPSLTFILI